MDFLTNLNLNKNELQNAVIQPLAVAPSNPREGQIYYDSTDQLLKQWNGTVWNAVGAVLSVNGKTGVVVLTQDDVGDGATYKRTHNDLTNALKTLIENTPLAIASMYSSSSAYAVGAYCIYEGKLYRCTTAIATGEAWTVGHWSQISVTGHFAPLASPALTGTPTAPTPAAGDSSTKIATTAFVQGAISGLANALIFKGVVNAASDLPATHKTGWTYKVATAGTYVGVVCEVGDTIVCVADGTAASNADWYVLQANIDGAVTGPASSVNGNIPVFNGTNGKVIKDGYGVVTTITDDDTKLPTAGAVHDAVIGLIKTATGSIGTSATTATVSYSGTLINAYAVMGGARVEVDVAIGAGSVTFTTAQAPASAVTCTVVYA